MQRGCNNGVAADAGSIGYTASWSLNATNTSMGVHPLGLAEYSLAIAPFDASLGRLYVAEMRFDVRVSFDGKLSSAGGGSGGACQGAAAFAYGDSAATPAFFGSGGGSGAGGMPSERVRWDFEMHERQVFEPSDESEVAGLSSASYAEPRERQCSGRGGSGCAGLPTGVCVAACRNESVAPLTRLTWAPSWPDGAAKPPTMCSYDTVNEAGVRSFDTLLASLEASLTFTYRYRAPPPPPLTPPGPPTQPPAPAAPPLLGIGASPPPPPLLEGVGGVVTVIAMGLSALVVVVGVVGSALLVLRSCCGPRLTARQALQPTKLLELQDRSRTVV